MPSPHGRRAVSHGGLVLDRATTPNRQGLPTLCARRVSPAPGLPRSPHQHRATRPPLPRRSSTPAPTPAAPRAPRVLVVEDDALLRTLVAQTLAEAGIEAVGTGDPDEALAVCRAACQTRGALDAPNAAPLS